MVHKFLLKQTHLNKVIKIIEREILKITHLPMVIKEIQAGHVPSPYFENIYLYLAQNKLPSSKGAMRQVETGA